MGENNYNGLAMKGKISVGNELRMELKSREEDGVLSAPLTHRKVVVGQPIQLVFTASKQREFNVNSCTAVNEKKTERIDIIESGCPSTGVSLDIVRGPISRTRTDSLIPLRAFKFHSGERVEIACEVEACEGNCRPINCSSSILRRNRRWNDSPPKCSTISLQYIVEGESSLDLYLWMADVSLFSLLLLSFSLLAIFFLILAKWRKSKEIANH
ncbi:hypothetical protein PMAYCL1PPCAC_29374 [Pristionchus mayeri]|uniref:ZP domain-containing protein n=1 Tax=Pristionchus mayeri TaxID=1317129 RepID=A0AAN5D9X8_9BILA|nr:hypothetical protein PMAYCL1PPCAC_29374 [Pristionchus mayeri]